MLQKMGNLLLVLSHADTAVKGHLCRQDTLLCQFELMQAAEPELLLKLLKSLKHLTLDPSTLPALQVIASALPFGDMCPCYLGGNLSLPGIEKPTCTALTVLQVCSGMQRHQIDTSPQ